MTTSPATAPIAYSPISAALPRPQGVEAFLSEWIAPQRSRVYANPPRLDYGPQYNGVGECPF